MTSSRSLDGGAESSPVAMLLLLFLRVLLHIVEGRFQAVKSRIPEVAVGLQPGVKLVERLGRQLVNGLLGNRLHLDEPGIASRAEVFGRRRLTEPKPHGGASHQS